MEYNEYSNAILENALEDFDETDDEDQTKRSSEEDVNGLIAEKDETEEPEDPLEEIMNQEIDDEFSTVREAMDSQTFLPIQFCLTKIEDEIITLEGNNCLHKVD